MRPLPPVQFRAVPLDPPPYGRVVNPDTRLRQKFRYLAVRQAEAQVPTDGAQDDLRFEVPPLEQKRTTEHGPFSLPFLPFKSLQHNQESCLERLILFGESSLRTAIQNSLAHYHSERHHQGLGNRLIEPEPDHLANTGVVQRRERLGGMLNYYYRAAA
jgi:hypothetical protein